MPSPVDKFGNLDYFGNLSWSNLLDWLVALCLGAIIAVLTVSLGGVRANTHVDILPLFSALLILHGLWIAVDRESPKRLSHIPVAFLPFLAWAVLSVYWLSPTAWLGRYELIYVLEAFIFFWVAVNNVRTRAQLWIFITIAMYPGIYAIFIGFYQFFQNPSKIASALSAHGVRLSPDFFGRATGSFADPHSFTVLLLLLLPVLLIAAAVPRLPVIIRVLCLYISLMYAAGLFFAQAFWSVFVIIPIIYIISSLSYRTLSKRLLLPSLAAFLLLVILGGLALFHPLFKSSYELATSAEGEGVRLVLWNEAGRIFLDQPIFGAGGGSFSMAFEQSPRVSLARLPETPHNDYLLVLSQYGLIGGLLLGLPICYVLFVGAKRWKLEPSRVKLKDGKGWIIPPQKFFLSLGLAGCASYALCSFFSFVFYIPALVLYGALFLSLLVKSSMTRWLLIPSNLIARLSYAVAGIALAWLLSHQATPLLQAQGMELEARQGLDRLVERRVHVSGNIALLDKVIKKYERAAELDPTNADIQIGLSSANCQLFFRNPARFNEIGALAVNQAQRATELSDQYWRAWAQLGVAHALSGNLEAAESALGRALELAPNSSNAHYYWAAFQSNFPEMRKEAIRIVGRALEINPNNPAARRLQQKLLIL
jgi:tetratricopeptide (TPR) repeat protein